MSLGTKCSDRSTRKHIFKVMQSFFRDNLKIQFFSIAKAPFQVACQSDILYFKSIDPEVITPSLFRVGLKHKRNQRVFLRSMWSRMTVVSNPLIPFVPAALDWKANFKPFSWYLHIH